MTGLAETEVYVRPGSNLFILPFGITVREGIEW